jgi:hypothetical protein
MSEKILKKISTYLKDLAYLVFKSAAENHLRIQKLKVDPKEGEQCDLSFNSYSDLKKYQRKVRLFTYSATSTVASVLVAVLIIQIFFPSARSQGATKTFTQNQWISQTSNRTSPDGSGNPPSNWTEYGAKDANLALVDGGATKTYLQLSSTTDARTDTTDTEFSTGATHSNTVVSGTGTGGSVTLSGSVGEVASLSDSACMLKNGMVYCWGNDGSGIFGDGTPNGIYSANYPTNQLRLMTQRT